MGKYIAVVDTKHGAGKLMKGDTLFHQVTYDITVCQEFYKTEPDQPPAPGLKDIQGIISFEEGVYPSTLMRQDFTLVLQDGAKIDLQLGPNGEIIPKSDEGFY